jgi:hypothetical protein
MFPPPIPPCEVCGEGGMFQNVYGSFCHLHWAIFWNKKEAESADQPLE